MYINTWLHAVAIEATAIQYLGQVTDGCNVAPQRFCLRMMLHKIWGQEHTWSLADVDVPVPLASLVPSLGYHFPFLVTVAILRFMPAPLLVALVVVLLSTRVPRAVTRLPVSVAIAAVGLVSVVMFAVWGIVVHVFVCIIFLWLHIGRVSALLGFRVKCLLPREATTRPTAVVLVCG